MRNSEGRRRKLRLRVYAVVCLNEECGLLEWVPNTSGFRHELSAVYAASGHEPPMTLCAKLREPFETMQRKYATDGKVRADRALVL